jgi:DNA-binding transcriptional LysR family regulator
MDRLTLMEIFVRVLESGSFSAAARHLNVGQSAVSKSIAQLEERLGVPLLMRSTHGLRPTEAGQTYYLHARRTIEEAEEADHAARDAGACLTGRLRISAGVTFASLYLIPHLAGFLRQYPKLSIEFVLDDRPIDLIEEGLDIALRYGPLHASSVIGRKVATTRRVVLATPDYFDRAGIPMTPADLIRHQVVIYTSDRDGGGTWVFRRRDAETSVTLPGRVRLNSSEGVRAAVLSGLGVAVVSQWLFKPELDCGAVCPVLTEWTLPDVELWVVFPTGRRASAKARAFAAFLQNEIDEHHAKQE